MTTSGGVERVTNTKLHPFCIVCGWRKGGQDSWDGNACKCGLSESPLRKGEPWNS